MSTKLDLLLEKKKLINSKINKILAQERKVRHSKAGKELEKLYRKGPGLEELSKVVSICERYF